MRAILDTHIFLWWNMGDPRLSSQIHDIIADGASDLFLSAASAWEIAIKAGRDRLVLPEPPDRYVSSRLSLHHIRPLPVLLSHALNVYDLPDHHRDPFDRLLVAQSQMEEMPLLTADPIFAKYDVATVF